MFVGMTEFSYDTPDTGTWDIWIATRHRTFLALAVTACSDVKILLSPIMWHVGESQDTYVITIDGNGNMTTIE